jgi:hypothetical protein
MDIIRTEIKLSDSSCILFTTFDEENKDYDIWVQYEDTPDGIMGDVELIDTCDNWEGALDNHVHYNTQIIKHGLEEDSWDMKTPRYQNSEIVFFNRRTYIIATRVELLGVGMDLVYRTRFFYHAISNNSESGFIALDGSSVMGDSLNEREARETHAHFRRQIEMFGNNFESFDYDVVHYPDFKPFDPMSLSPSLSQSLPRLPELRRIDCHVESVLEPQVFGAVGSVGPSGPPSSVASGEQPVFNPNAFLDDLPEAVSAAELGILPPIIGSQIPRPLNTVYIPFFTDGADDDDDMPVFSDINPLTIPVETKKISTKYPTTRISSSWLQNVKAMCADKTRTYYCSYDAVLIDNSESLDDIMAIAIATIPTQQVPPYKTVTFSTEDIFSDGVDLAFYNNEDEAKTGHVNICSEARKHGKNWDNYNIPRIKEIPEPEPEPQAEPEPESIFGEPNWLNFFKD